MKKNLLILILMMMFCPLMFGQNKVSVNLICNPEGAAVLSGSGTYNVGTMVEVTATTNPGYTFTNWSVDDELRTLNYYKL